MKQSATTAIVRRLDGLERRAWSAANKYVLVYVPRRFERCPVPATLVMPLAAKDVVHAESSVEAWRKHLLHDIVEVVIPGQDHPSVAEFAKRIGARYVNENEILPEAVKSFRFGPGGQGRNGWIRQQVLKMSAHTYCATEHMIVTDSDTRPIRPLSFWHKGKPVLFVSDEYVSTYHETIDRLLGPIRHHRRSFVTHCLLREREVQKSLRNAIETHCGMPVIDAVLGRMDITTHAAFAECEMYGTYVMNAFRDRFQTAYWFNRKVTQAISPRDGNPDFEGGPAHRRFNFVSRHIH
jgi:Family of unknown function (DUF6492)